MDRAAAAGPSVDGIDPAGWLDGLMTPVRPGAGADILPPGAEVGGARRYVPGLASGPSLTHFPSVP